jgi:hypothetical protein
MNPYEVDQMLFFLAHCVQAEVGVDDMCILGRGSRRWRAKCKFFTAKPCRKVIYWTYICDPFLPGVCAEV